MATPAEVLSEALELPENERSWVVSQILESFPKDPGLSQAWHQEIAERVQRRETGQTQHVSSEDVHRQMKNIFSS